MTLKLRIWSRGMDLGVIGIGTFRVICLDEIIWEVYID